MQRKAFPGLLTVAVAIAAALTFSSTASAELVQNVKVPMNAVVTNDCLGETVQMSGELHLVVTTQQTGNGLRVTQHSNPLGVFGTGLTSGDSFRGLGVTKLTTFFDGEAPFDITFVNNFTLKALDGETSARIHQNVHISVNAQGEITANVDNLKTSCS